MYTLANSSNVLLSHWSVQLGRGAVHTINSIPVLVEAVYCVEGHLVESNSSILTAYHLNTVQSI